ncbi:hypothetical protein [Rhodoblastus sp.]|jgi:hypothetical protein|uniref:hypothetical protein n=1 Tax=Rhodoblastus sp. TaxID=1962975 RepID=UPI002600FEEB|nr:hypothetical protein [Rhodoblastus sp.]
MNEDFTIFTIADGPPKLLESMVPFYTKLIAMVCRTPEHKRAALAALEARSIKIDTIIYGWPEAAREAPKC